MVRAVGRTLPAALREVAPFNDLQQRLNRRVVTKRRMAKFPAHVRFYGALAIDGEDLRGLAFDERRRRLEAWHGKLAPPRTDLSEILDVASTAELEAIRAAGEAGQLDGLERLIKE